MIGRRLVVSDLDDTLTGDAADDGPVREWLARRDFLFCIATGRDLDSALGRLRERALPLPDFWITDVGTRITELRTGGRVVDDEDWQDRFSAFDGDAVRSRVLEEFGLPLQGRQTRLKASFRVTDAALVARVGESLHAAGLGVETIFSHGRYLDLLPPNGSKGYAVRYLAERLEIPLGEVLAAGDSANDLSMLQMVGRPVVVANHHSELAALAVGGKVFVSTAPRGLGVMEGVRHYGIHHDGIRHDGIRRGAET